MFNPLQYLKDYGIQFATEGEDISPGWVGVRCPFCGDPMFHGGFNLNTGHYSCWRCGWHPIEDVIKALSKVPYHEACAIVKQYENGLRIPLKQVSEVARSSATDFPVGTGPITETHRKYLKGRNFDTDYLESKYNLKGTGPVGHYKYRIIIPIYLDGVLVSYQGRDITGKSKLRYKACRKEKEVLEHKHTLYGIDHTTGDVCVVVEGVTDQWRMGDGSVATFGTEWTLQQALMLSERFKKVFTLFDPESPAQDKAKKLGLVLLGWGVDWENITLNTNKDPGALDQKEADKIMEDLLK